jgi:hypothetical protein
VTYRGSTCSYFTPINGPDALAWISKWPVKRSMSPKKPGSGIWLTWLKLMMVKMKIWRQMSEAGLLKDVAIFDIFRIEVAVRIDDE